MSVAETMKPVIHFDRKGLSDKTLLDLYRAILLPRIIEEKMLILLRQNKISKWFSGIGQEAIAVGCTKALETSDYIFPLHRNLGVFTAREVNLVRLFCQWQGKKNGFTKGRDRSFHFGTQEYRIIGMISHLGAMLGVADGVSLASNLDQDSVISLVFSGDGGASEGDFHEAINVAAVWDLPVIFLIENNGYGLSTPSSDQFRCKQFIDKAIGYGIEAVQVDGNNIVDVYVAVQDIAQKMRQNRKPVILEAMTFRMRGHEEASGTKYVPKELQDFWATKDPVRNYEAWLLEIGVLQEAQIQEIRSEFKHQIEQALEQTFAQPEITPDTEEELADVYAPAFSNYILPTGEEKEMRTIDAISQGLKQAMLQDPNLILMGQDIAEYGGVFKITDGFVQEFGKERVRNTPLCESAIIATGLGLSLRDKSAMVEMQFADFVSCGFNQIVNNLAKNHYRWQQPVNVTVRMPTGAGVAAGPFHSQSNEAWFFKVPGLKVVYPSNPYSAKGLLTTSLREPNPVIFFEHKVLYRSISGLVPQQYYNLPLGKAVITKFGTDITIVTYGMGVHWALEISQLIPDTSIEIIDLQTLLPWDSEMVFSSVKKTGKCLVLHEDTLTGGVGAEIAAAISEEMFRYLDAPVMRVGSLDTPIPFTANLEKNFLPKNIFHQKLLKLIDY
ncbi:MAG: dehydrogenase E1 component subunit alpha/beta [Bacteroidia bacterium]|nr:dehydrogenase E1 component subunit alpha/beta [Bacteroidia bacterium]